MRCPRPNHWLLALCTQVLKYFLLSVAGCTVAYIAAIALNWGLLAEAAAFLLAYLLRQGFLLVICLVAITIISESIQG
ncbi:hypothetical protein [Nodosilinea sp. FACHB-13]|uniref:hypothetical protein n=1 Tax=Cyanophyceae TaxID=3028117 RepID=UPI001687B350|nr:hypothetical protein [Nodosilinea sp. FACHB-13]MBD2108795.1 hypothetical protein [Nodosilinea sp. FACHB-13]